MILFTVLFVVSFGDCQIDSVGAKAPRSINITSVDELINAGDSLYNKGKYEEAITYFDKVLALEPKDTDTLYSKGISLEGLGKHKEAITYFDKVLALEPNDTDTLAYKGISLESLGKHKEAITYFDKVLALDPDNTNALSWKEYSLNSMIDSLEIEKAKKLSNKIDDSLSPSNEKEFDIKKDRARDLLTYFFSSLFPETGEKFSNADYGVDISFPKNWTGFEMKVIFPMAVVSPEGFNIRGLFRATIDSVADNIAENIHSDNMTELPEQKRQELIESLSNKLTEYIQNATYTMSVMIYDKEMTRLMISANPNGTMPIDSLTSLYERFVAYDPTISCDRKSLDQIVLNSNISAEKSTEQCLYTASNKIEDNLNYFVLTPKSIIGIHYTTNQNNDDDVFLPEFEEALKSLNVQESLPINNQTLRQFVNNVSKNKNDYLSGNNNSQNKFIDTKNKNDPLSSIFTSRDVLNYTDKGNELFDEGKYDQAITYYDKALAIDPNDYAALYNKGVALANLEKYEEAVTYYDKVLTIDPNDFDALNNKGIALAELGRYEEAISWFDKVLEIDSIDVTALNNKGLALANLGRYVEANNWYDKALAIDANSTAALYNKGVALHNLARYEDAISWYDKALAIDPKYVDALNYKGATIYQLGRNQEEISNVEEAKSRYEEAISWYDKALAIDPKYVHSLNSKALALAKLGNLQEALKWTDRALAIDPTNEEARNMKSHLEAFCKPLC